MLGEPASTYLNERSQPDVAVGLQRDSTKMANTHRQEVVWSFAAWRGRLEQAAQPTLNDEVRQFLGYLATVGTPLIEGSTVHFIYYAPQARAVALTGEFNDWGRTGVTLPMTRVRETGIFYRTLELSVPARLEYKLLVDGRMILDPQCPQTVDNGIGEANSYFVIGNVSEPPELTWVPTIPHGRLEEFEFESRLLRNRRRIRVHLPPGYDEDPGRRFPILYVHDGSEYLKRGL